MDNAKKILKEKLEECHSKLSEKWHEMSKDELIRQAAEIASVNSVYAELNDLVSEEEAAELLKYEDPLSVVSDLFAMGEADDSSEFSNDYRRIINKLTGLTEVDISELGYTMTI